MTRPSLLIAEHPAIRLGIRMALEREVEVRAEADDAEHAIRTAKRLQPDICLVGRDIPGALHAVRGICRAALDAAVVVLAEVPDAEDLLDCVQAGAIGYVPGAVDVERLRRVIRAVQAGEAVIPRSMVLGLLLELRDGDAEGGPLTGRETQVLRLLRRGHTTAAIAHRLDLAPVTVRRHISGIVHKLGVEDRSRLTDGRGRWGNIAGEQRPLRDHTGPRRTA